MIRLRHFLLTLFLVRLIVAPLTAGAHEFWIEPVRFRVDTGSEIVADLKRGQDFKGDALPYLPNNSKEAWVVDLDGKRPPRQRIGDIPAFREAPDRSGLHILAYYSTPSRLTYKEPGKFARFLENKGLGRVLREHRERGLPETGFSEAYSRCAKALVQSGDGGGGDVEIGMPIELVTKANPYALPAAETALPVALLWQGEPLANAQITVFREKDGLEVTKVRTGPNGDASIPLHDGGRFLLNAVHIIPWNEKPKDAWHSYWASLTFEISAGQ